MTLAVKDKYSKVSFIGIALSGSSVIESAAALIDSSRRIIMLDKMFSVSSIKYYLDNFAGIQNAVIMVSIPNNEVMLGSKWKYSSRTYDLVNFDVKMLNREDWTNRYSARGSEYFRELKDKGADIFRYDIDNAKKVMCSSYVYKDRSPADCKALQDTLRIKYKFHELPVNMLPAAQLEAVLGALTAYIAVFGSDEFEIYEAGSFENLPAAGCRKKYSPQ